MNSEFRIMELRKALQNIRDLGNSEDADQALKDDDERADLVTTLNRLTYRAGDRFVMRTRLNLTEDNQRSLHLVWEQFFKGRGGEESRVPPLLIVPFDFDFQVISEEESPSGGVEPISVDPDGPADYYYFKAGGKWAYEGKGASIPIDGHKLTHARIAELNGDSMPGIVSSGTDYIVVVIDPESFPHIVFPKE